MDRLFHSLIYLFGREEHDRLHADHASSSYGQRDGGRSPVVRHVKDNISGLFAEGETEPLEAKGGTKPTDCTKLSNLQKLERVGCYRTNYSDETASWDQSGSGSYDGKTLRKGHPDLTPIRTSIGQIERMTSSTTPFGTLAEWQVFSILARFQKALCKGQL